MRTFRRPPQGTVATFDPAKHARLVEAGAERMLNQTQAATTDKDIAALQEALDYPPNKKEISRLIPILRARYGQDLWLMVKGTPPRRKRT